jgi:hypothetical protein
LETDVQSVIVDDRYQRFYNIEPFCLYRASVLPFLIQTKGHGSLPHVDRGQVTENSKNVQEPQNHGNDHNGIQNRLYGSPAIGMNRLTSHRRTPTTIRTTTT